MGIRVLIIDDDSDLTRIWGEYLGGMGHEVHEAATGEHGVSTCTEVSPDLVLVDWTLPGLRGAPLIVELHNACDSAIIVVVTGHSPGAVAVDGVREVLRKPFRLRELSRVVSEASA